MSISPGYANPGDTISILVKLSSSTEVAGYQFTSPISPEAFDFIQIRQSGVSLLNDYWDITINHLYNGLEKIIGFCLDDQNLVGLDLEIAELLIAVKSDASPGIYPVQIENPVTCNKNGNILPCQITGDYLTISGTDVVFDLTDDTLGFYDQCKRLTLLMSTFTPVAGFQIDITDSADIFEGVECNNPFGDEWNVNCSELDNGAFRILVSSTSGALIPDSSYYELIFTVRANSGLYEGKYPVSLDNVVVSDENSERLTVSATGATISLDSTLLSSFDLLLPVSESRMEGSDNAIEFIWNKSSFPTNPVITYNVRIGIIGQGVLPDVFPSNNSGLDTALTLSMNQLKNVLKSRDYQIQNPTEIYWWVEASDDQRKRKSESTYNLIIEDLNAIDTKTEQQLTVFRLLGNYPNPFNAQTTIRFEIPSRVPVKILIFNLLGQQVTTLINDDLPSGNHQIFWDGLDQYGKSMMSGIYFLSFQAGDYHQTHKMILLK